jgi:DNA sulfur modification protein DndD
MRIDSITLNNFRQYYGSNFVDLTTTETSNIILIGGKNGYGKTNFLLSLVWCLYGEDIAKIDDNFRKEIQKDGNYSKFLKGTLNETAQKKGDQHFSVEMTISGVELPEMQGVSPDQQYACTVKREYDAVTSIDSFDIHIQGVATDILKSLDDKINFVNDYLIPIEAAKFVFFDAEKIASWAELNTKEEGAVLNDAIGKILGLDVYEDLVRDLHIYTDGLRKESATNQVRQQIITTEKGIQLNAEKIEAFETDISEKQDKILKFKEEIAKYESYLAIHSNKTESEGGLDTLYQQRNQLKNKVRELELDFNELAESLPFAIAAAHLEDVIVQMSIQENNNSVANKNVELASKTDEVIERVFNHPPEPSDGGISWSKKAFYAEKLKSIIQDIFTENVENAVDLEFEHDLTRSDNELLRETFDLVKQQSENVFEATIQQFNAVKDEISGIDNRIKKIESDAQDEEIIDYTNKKADLERKVEKLIEEKGAVLNQKDIVKRETENLNLSLQVLLKRISVSQHKAKKLDKANDYIEALEGFIKEQKSDKCQVLETLIYEEMQKLMHKLSNTESSGFIAAVKAEVLPENNGLKITLYNDDGEVRAKESLSQGEKQIYISCLIKAIISLSISEYPIFIDTPLGRLDDEHIRQILVNYYPDLANQVVLMATNNEIPPSRYKLVKQHVARTYLLENNSRQTTFKKGYFQNYEN